MMENGSYYTLGDVVSSYLNNRGENDLSNYKRFLNIAAEGYSHIGMRLSVIIERTYLTVNENNIAIIPPDYQNKIILGIIYNNRFFELTEKSNIIPPKEACGDLVAGDGATNTTENPLHMHYGETGGYNMGYYRIFEDLGYIVFEGYIVPYPVYFEYVSTGVKPTKESLVPSYTVPAIREYINMTVKSNDDNASVGEKYFSHRKWEAALETLNSYRNRFTLTEIRDIRLKSFKQTAKR